MDLASAHSEAQTIVCKTDKSLTFDFSILDIESLLDEIDLEVEVPEYQSIMPDKPEIKETRINLAYTEVIRIKPCL